MATGGSRWAGAPSAASTSTLSRARAAAAAALAIAATACGAIPQGAKNPYCVRNCWVQVVEITGNKADQLNPQLGDTAATATKSETTTKTESGGP